MKVLFAYFSSESNEHSRSLMTFDKFVFKFGEEAVQHVSCRKVFEDAGIELIPAIIAICVCEPESNIRSFWKGAVAILPFGSPPSPFA